jgi:hypothetical protein
LFFFASAVIVFPVSSQSLWIDEGISVLFASQPSFEELIEKIIGTRRAESLMPGYVIYLWAWIKLFGFSEYYLRLSNAPLVIMALFLMSQLPLKNAFKIFALLTACLSPFLWYYMNEVRSYMALFSFSAMALSGVVFYFHGSPKWKRFGPSISVISLFFGSFFNMSCGFALPALIVAGFFLYSETKSDLRAVIRNWAKPVLISAPFVLLLGGYYASIVLEGSGGRLQHAGAAAPDLRHIALVFYEFLGFMGLGPPRNVLRSAPSLGTLTPYLVLAIPFALLLVCTAVGLAIVSRKPSSNGGAFLKNPYLWGFAAGFLVFGIFAFVTKFVFYGRHLLFLYPFFIFAIARAFAAIWHIIGRSLLGLAAIAGLLSMFVISDLRLRFDPQYFKDDYRLAAHTALSIGEPGDPIFWAANLETGAFYGLFFSDIAPSRMVRPPTWEKLRKAVFATNWTLDKIDEETSALDSAVLVLSKVDLFDTKGGWRAFVKEHEPVAVREFDQFRIYRFDLHRES